MDFLRQSIKFFSQGTKRDKRIHIPILVHSFSSNPSVELSLDASSVDKVESWELYAVLGCNWVKFFKTVFGDDVKMKIVVVVLS